MNPRQPRSPHWKVLLTAVGVLFTFYAANSQTIYIANNNPGAVGGTNVFTGGTAFNDAIAAASNGDIIYVVPSPNNYGDIGVNKSVTIYGGGFNPDKDNALFSMVGVTRIDIFSSNVRLSGLTISGITYLNGAINNVMFDECVIRQVVNNGGASQGNIMFQRNIIGQGIAMGQYVMNMGVVSSGIVISNNIIYTNQSTSFGLINTSNGTTVENNIFIGHVAGSNTKAFDNFNNGTIKNNIFFGIEPNSIGNGTFLNNNLEFNLSFGAANNTFPTGNGNTSVNNIENSDPLFVNLPYATAYVFTNDPSLQVGSMAIGNGESGIDMGALGGGAPFDVEGTPLPLVQVLDLPPTIAQGKDLPVNIKGKGN